MSPFFVKRLIHDTVLSAAGSLAGILLMRGVTGPVPGFVGIVMLWVGAGAALTAAALALAGSRVAGYRYASLRGYGRLSLALGVKAVGMIVLGLTGVIGLPSYLLLVIALFADTLFTAAALFGPRLFVRTVRRSDRDIRTATELPNVLVSGIGRESIALADDLFASGSYNVLGYLSDKPDHAGMVIGNLTVYAAPTHAEFDALQWRLGGIDAIFYPGVTPRPTPRRRRI